MYPYCNRLDVKWLTVNRTLVHILTVKSAAETMTSHASMNTLLSELLLAGKAEHLFPIIHIHHIIEDELYESLVRLFSVVFCVM